MHPMRALFLIPRNPPPKLKSKKWSVPWVAAGILAFILRKQIALCCAVLIEFLLNLLEFQALSDFPIIFKSLFIQTKSHTNVTTK